MKVLQIAAFLIISFATSFAANAQTTRNTTQRVPTSGPCLRLKSEAPFWVMQWFDAQADLKRDERKRIFENTEAAYRAIKRHPNEQTQRALKERIVALKKRLLRINNPSNVCFKSLDRVEIGDVGYIARPFGLKIKQSPDPRGTTFAVFFNSAKLVAPRGRYVGVPVDPRLLSQSSQGNDDGDAAEVASQIDSQGTAVAIGKSLPHEDADKYGYFAIRGPVYASAGDAKLPTIESFDPASFVEFIDSAKSIAMPPTFEPFPIPN